MPKKGGRVMTHGTMVRLPEDAGEALEHLATDLGLAPAVAARMLIIEALRERHRLPPANDQHVRGNDQHVRGREEGVRV